MVYNLSSSGAFVRSLAAFDEGTRLDAELSLPSFSGTPLYLGAVVAWAFNREVGWHLVPGIF